MQRRGWVIETYGVLPKIYDTGVASDTGGLVPDKTFLRHVPGRKENVRKTFIELVNLSPLPRPEQKVDSADRRDLDVSRPLPRGPPLRPSDLRSSSSRQD